MKTLIKYVVVAVFAFAVGFSFHSCDEEYGVGKRKASWMPPGASDGAYHHLGSFLFLGPPYYRFEYKISEPDFVAYLQSKDLAPREIEEPVFVRRYLRRFVRSEDYNSENGPDLERYNAATGITIADGLVWDYRFEDHSTIYAYDRKLSRAFIEINTR